MKKIIFLVVLVSFTFFGLSFASVNLVNENLETNYSEGDIIKGKIFLTLDNQSTSSIVSSNFQGNKTLIQLIRAQSNLNVGMDYTCTTPDCGKKYTSQEFTSGFTINSDNKKYAGFVITGQSVSVKHAQFSVQSNVAASCTPQQIKIDVLDDEIEILANLNNNGQSCGQRYRGCYNLNNTLKTNITTGIEYCEKINLPASSGFIVGGEVKNGTSNANLTMKLYDITDGGIVGTCQLPKNTQTIQELSCVIDYVAPVSRDYFVCILTSNTSGFQIGWETLGENCGIAQGLEYIDGDFDLFAETAMYSASPNFIVNDTNYNNQFGSSLASKIDEYVASRYNRECQNSSCIVPISFSGANQFIQIYNISLEYNSSSVLSSLNVLHELNPISDFVSGNNLSIDISKANFTIPFDSNEDKLKIFIDENKIIEKDITIKDGFMFDIFPKAMAFGQTIQFSIMANRTINSSSWNFGDNTPIRIVNGGQAVHTYTSQNISIFQIRVTARDNFGLETTKSFNVFVGNPKEFANFTITDYKKRIENLTIQISSQPSWTVQALEKAVQLKELRSRLNASENKFKTAITTNDFENVMLGLIELRMPKALSVVLSLNNLPLVTSLGSVNPDYIERISKKDIADNSKLSKGIVSWMNDKFSAEINFKSFALIRDFEDNEIVASQFAIETKPIKKFEKTTYLIFGQDIEKSGVYKSEYPIKSLSGLGIDYVPVSSSENEIYEFLINMNLPPENLGAYISPEVNYINIEVTPEKTCNLDGFCSDNEDADSCPEDCSKTWITFSIISWIVLIIAFIVTYIILQEWYKQNYQKRLFPDENELYNLMNFIYNARRAKLSDEQIKVKLEAIGRNSEKIDFVFKKIEGKRIGMLEIPIFTNIQHNKTIANLSAKIGAPVDTKFIKRPSFKKV